MILSIHLNYPNDQYVKSPSAYIKSFLFLLIIIKRFVCTSIKCCLTADKSYARHHQIENALLQFYNLFYNLYKSTHK